MAQRVDGLLGLTRYFLCGLGVVFVGAGVDDGARGVDDDAAAVRGLSGLHGGGEVAALCPDAGDQQRHVADDGAYLRDFIREGGADDEGALTMGIPFVGDFVRDDLVQRLARLDPRAFGEQTLLQYARHLGADLCALRGFGAACQFAVQACLNLEPIQIVPLETESLHRR